MFSPNFRLNLCREQQVAHRSDVSDRLDRPVAVILDRLAGSLSAREVQTWASYVALGRQVKGRRCATWRAKVERWKGAWSLMSSFPSYCPFVQLVLYLLWWLTGGECRPRFVSCFTQAFSSLLSTSSTSPFRFEEGKIPVLFRATYDAKKVKLIWSPTAPHFPRPCK